VCDAGLDRLEELADERLDVHPDSPLASILDDMITNARQRKRDCEVLRSERDEANKHIVELERQLATAKALCDELLDHPMVWRTAEDRDAQLVMWRTRRAALDVEPKAETAPATTRPCVVCRAPRMDGAMGWPDLLCTQCYDEFCAWRASCPKCSGGDE
jgi:hypothetical protein